MKNVAKGMANGAWLLSFCLFCAASLHAVESEDIRGPDVTIFEEEERTVFEYRQGGVLRMVKVVPRFGKPYFLVPADNTTLEEDLERADMLLPSWVIVEF